jgi:DNA-binding transcriptional ArsR family regulator
VILTAQIVGDIVAGMLDIAVIQDPAAAEVSLDPIRARLLAELAEPASATMLAARVGLPRQKVNYHLRSLEQHGLVELVEERRRGNCTERLLRATAASYVISPAALAAVAPDPARAPDRLSARWLLAVASGLVRDLGELIGGAAQARKPLATFAIDGEVRFASAADRAAFARELAAAVTALVGRYHDETAAGGREHRVIVAVHPSVRTPTKET